MAFLRNEARAAVSSSEPPDRWTYSGKLPAAGTMYESMQLRPSLTRTVTFVCGTPYMSCPLLREQTLRHKAISQLVRVQRGQAPGVGCSPTTVMLSQCGEVGEANCTPSVVVHAGTRSVQ